MIPDNVNFKSVLLKHAFPDHVTKFYSQRFCHKTDVKHEQKLKQKQKQKPNPIRKPDPKP